MEGTVSSSLSEVDGIWTDTFRPPLPVRILIRLLGLFVLPLVAAGIVTGVGSLTVAVAVLFGLVVLVRSSFSFARFDEDALTVRNLATRRVPYDQIVGRLSRPGLYGIAHLRLRDGSSIQLFAVTKNFPRAIGQEPSRFEAQLDAMRRAS